MGRVNAGQLNQRVTLIWDGAAVPDGEGGFTAEADTRLTIWARVQAQAPRQSLETGQVLTQQVHKVTIRPIQSQPPPDRVEWRGLTLSVAGTVPDEYHEYRILTCTDAGQ